MEHITLDYILSALLTALTGKAGLDIWRSRNGSSRRLTKEDVRDAMKEAVAPQIELLKDVRDELKETCEHLVEHDRRAIEFFAEERGRRERE